VCRGSAEKVCGFVCVEECLEGLGVFVRVIRCVCVHACVRAGRGVC